MTQLGLQVADHGLGGRQGLLDLFASATLIAEQGLYNFKSAFDGLLRHGRQTCDALPVLALRLQHNDRHFAISHKATARPIGEGGRVISHRRRRLAHLRKGTAYPCLHVFVHCRIGISAVIPVMLPVGAEQFLVCHNVVHNGGSFLHNPWDALEFFVQPRAGGAEQPCRRSPVIFHHDSGLAIQGGAYPWQGW